MSTPASTRRTSHVSRPLVAAVWRSLLRRGVCIGLCAVACVVALALHGERAAAAATYTVGSISDIGTAGTQAQCLDPKNTACRLRDAIGFAISGSDTIVFNSSGRGTITVGSTLRLAASVTITGPTSGAGVTVDGGHAVQVFAVNGGVTASIANLTIANGNTGGGGGIYNNGGTLTVTNSTLSGNSAPSGGGIYNGGSLNLTNTIVAGNSTPNGYGAITTNDHNLIGGTPLLGPLASNGGPTQTFALLAGSPAIGAGDATVCASTSGTARVSGKDQRGLPRPATTCSIGAFEAIQTYTVGSISDTGAAGTLAQCLDPTNTACRLRDAIGFAISGSDTIVFNSTGRGTITVGSTLTLAVSVTITGPTSGAGVTVQAAATPHSATYGVFVVNSVVTASITNLTIANGNSPGDGGGIYNNGGTLTVTNSTLSGNSAINGLGGGIFNVGTVHLTNTIVASNTASSGPDINGAVVSEGHNLISDTSGSSGITNADAQGDIVSATPLLAPLGSYGGPTETIALLPGSPAIDAGDDSACNQTTGTAPVNNKDQRGVTRPVGAHCDIGAFESQGFTLTKTSGDTQSTPVTTTFTNPLVVTVAPSTAGAADNEPVNNGVVTFTGPGSGADLTTDPQTATIAGGQGSLTPTANSTPGAYTVKAAAVGTTPAFVSFSLTNVGPATHLAFTQSPPNSVVAGAPFTVQVTAEDVNGNTDTAYAGQITLVPSVADTGASGLGVAAANGVATFSAILTKATTGQTLTANGGNGLTSAPTNPFAVIAAAPATITGAPASESAAVNGTFGALTATVKDTYGNPVAGITVTLVATPAGNGATLGGGTLSQTTDASGVATFADLTANTTAGTYTVATTAPRVTTPASFTLTNTAGAPGSITAMAGTPQSATVGTAFGAALHATVEDANGNVVPNVTVTFTAPASGASGVFTGGGGSVTAVTNAQGIATAPAFTANDTAGGYTVTASVSGVGTAARFSLTNTAAALRSITFSLPASVGSPPSVKVGQTVAFTATGTYGDGSTQNLSSQVQWSSSNPQVATVDAMGNVKGESPGTGTITASLHGVTQTVVVTVAGPTPIGIVVPPAPAARPGGTASVPGAAPAPAPAPRASGGGAAPAAVTSGPPPAPIPAGR